MSEKIFDRFIEARRRIDIACDATAATLKLFSEAVSETCAAIQVFGVTLKAFRKWREQEQRLYFSTQLSAWLPDILAEWLANHWPTRWLPHPKFDEVE